MSPPVSVRCRGPVEPDARSRDADLDGTRTRTWALRNKVASDRSLVTVSSSIGTLIDDGTAAEARQTLIAKGACH